MQCCATQQEHDPYLDSFDCEAFERKIQRTIDEHSLFTRESKVLVACSGGKDSTVILYALKRLGYPVEAITVDAHIGCYTEENLKNLREMCRTLEVKLHEIAFRKEFGRSMCYMQAMLKSNGYDYRNCRTCGVLRRYLLNKHSKVIKPDVLVTGHNLDDEAQAFLMNLIRGQLRLSARSGPKTMGADAGFIPRVKPMYFCHERDVVAYSKLKGLPVKYGECPCSSDAYRREMKRFLKAFGAETVKANLIAQLTRLAPALRGHYASAERAEPCSLCGEPASGSMCAACLILSKLEAPRQELPILAVTP